MQPVFKFNPRQARDSNGRWAASGGGGVHVDIRPDGSLAQYPQSTDRPWARQDTMRFGRMTQNEQGKFKWEEYDDPERVAALRGGMQRFVDENPIAVRVPDERLDTMLTEGRLKNRHEGHPMDDYRDRDRMKSDKAGFGIPFRAPGEERPVFGYVSPPHETVDPVTGAYDINSKHLKGAQFYGENRVVLHDHIKDRSTVTWGDSMNEYEHILPSPARKVRLHSTQESNYRTVEDYTRAMQEGKVSSTAYVEAQIHGGITMADVHHIDFGDHPNEATIALLAQHGLGYDWATRRASRTVTKEAGVFNHIAKANDQGDEWRYTLGPVYMPGQVDAHGDSIDAAELERAVHEYVQSGDRDIRLQHMPDTKAGEWVGLLTWPWDVEMPVLAEDGGTVTRSYPAGTPFMGVVWEPEVWDAVKSGAIRGYSLGGFAEFEQETPVGPPVAKAEAVAPTTPTDLDDIDPALHKAGCKCKRCKQKALVLKFNTSQARDDFGKWTDGPMGSITFTPRLSGKDWKDGPGKAKAGLRPHDEYLTSDKKYHYVERAHTDLKVGDEVDIDGGFGKAGYKEREYRKVLKISHPERGLTVAHYGDGEDNQVEHWAGNPALARYEHNQGGGSIVPKGWNKETHKARIVFVPKQVPVLKFNPHQARDKNGKWTSGGFGGGGTGPGAGKVHPSQQEVPHGSLGEQIQLSDHEFAAIKKESSMSGQHIIQDAEGHYHWSPEREALHKRIIEDHLRGIEASKHPVQYMNGGGPGSGKSSLRVGDVGKMTGYPSTREVDEMTGVPKWEDTPNPKAVLIDPDAIKMMLPEVKAAREVQFGHVPGKVAGEHENGWAGNIHEESSYIAKRVHAAALDRHMSLLYDGTGDSGLTGVTKKVNMARAKGYRVEANYLYLEPSEGISRALGREKRTGRRVPESQIRHTYGDVPRTFDGVKHGVFDTIRVFDNNAGHGKPARLIGSGTKDGGFTVHDQETYDRFISSQNRTGE